MELGNQTVLITGGTSGIGMALAERFVKSGSKVIICGRREDALQEMKSKFPEMEARVCDTGRASDRVSLVKWVTDAFPKLNVVINNAGIQRRINLTEKEDWSTTQSEIDVNLSGPIHLCQLFIPHLQKQAKAHLMNVSSGLAFAPMAAAPIYCATKAALHSFTLSLRHQLRSSTIEVTEIIPPAVKTNLGGSHDFGAELSEFADSIMDQIKQGKAEATFGHSASSSQASRQELDQIFKRMNG